MSLGATLYGSGAARMAWMTGGHGTFGAAAIGGPMAVGTGGAAGAWVGNVRRSK